MDQTNPKAVSATLDCLDGIVLSLVFDGQEVAQPWRVSTASEALERIAAEADRHDVEVHLQVTGDSLPSGAPAASPDGRLVALPGGIWLPGATQADAAGPATPRATLTHRDSDGIAATTGDLFEVDSAEFTPAAAPQPARTAAAAPPPADDDGDGDATGDLADVFAATADDPTTAATTDDDEPPRVSIPAQASEADPRGMSRGELDEWVARELLNPEKASSASGSIRTRTRSANGPSVRQRTLAAVGLAVIGALGAVGIGAGLMSQSNDDGPDDTTTVPVTGPFDISPAVMTAASGAAPKAIPGYRQTWTLKGKGLSLAVTRYALVRAAGLEMAVVDPATGKTITKVPAHGRVDAVLSGKIAGPDGSLTRVLVWQNGSTLNVQSLDGRTLPKATTVDIPKGATISARLDGILISDPAKSSKVGLLVSHPTKAKKPGKKPGQPQFGAAIRWLAAATPASAPADPSAQESETGVQTTGGIQNTATANPGRRWAYAATPTGKVWWLNSDGTAVLPSGTQPGAANGPVTVTAGQPMKGLAFAGWLGAGFGATGRNQPTAHVLVGVWRDPADSSLVLATYDAANSAASGQATDPVAAVAVADEVAQKGTSGTTSPDLGIGSWLIDSGTGQITASGTKHGFQVGGVYGQVAEIVTPDGHLGFITADHLAAVASPAPSSPSTPSSASPTGSSPTGSSAEGGDSDLTPIGVPSSPVDIIGSDAQGDLIATTKDGKVIGLAPVGPSGGGKK